MTSALQIRSRPTAALALGIALATLLAGAPVAAKPRAPERSAPRVDRAAAAHAAQLKRLEQGKAAIARLSADARRRRYRDGWEAIGLDLDAALRADATGPNAAETAFWSAQARGELWNVSRTHKDALAAVAAYRAVDAKYPGTEPAGRALISAVQLAVHVHDSRLAALAARSLQRYPHGAEAAAALALVHDQSAAEAVAAKPAAPPDPGTRAAGKADRKAQRPAGDDGDDDGASNDAAAAPRPARTAAAEPRAGRGEERAARSAPRSPQSEPDVDVPAEAAHILDAIVEATRGAAEAGAAGGAAALEAARTDSAAASAPAQKPATAGEHAAAAAAVAAADEEDDAADSPPEPEAPEEVARATPQAPARKLSMDERESEVEAAQKARELRTLALSAHAGSVAAQLGLKVRKVVIDAGHGGKDTGAIGPHGLREKDVALAIARKLAVQLRAQGLTVVMTRDADVFVPLDDRTRIANEAGADLFVSIHCNAAQRRKLSGVETWTLNVASDRYAARLAAFENSEDERTVSELRLILADLATKANASDARELAQAVQASLVRNLRARIGSVKDHGVKQALFYVLLGTHMPSILVETAFLSNPEEEKRLKSVRYQDGAAEAIARGVRDFLDGRRRLALAP